MSVEIPLTQGLVAIVDDADGERVLAAGQWYPRRERGLVVAVTHHAWRTNGRRYSQGMQAA